MKAHQSFLLKLFAYIALLLPTYTFAQTHFFNKGATISVLPNTIFYVGGDITNDVAGTIHNQGDIYFTHDWTNNDIGGALDPNTGKVILYGNTTQNINGVTTTFNNLDCQFGSTKKLNVNTTVGGTNGLLELNSSPFDLNSFTCNITNPSTSAITRTSGYIISETEPIPGYGRVQWNIDNSTGNYVVPFGSTSGSYIPFEYNVTTAGSTGGNISVATYPTSTSASPNNQPWPNGVTDFNYQGSDYYASAVDRFWIMDLNYTTNPTADLTFSYLSNEATGGNNSINESDLQAWRWDGTQWKNPTVGSYLGTQQVRAVGIDYSGPWTLALKTIDSLIAPEVCNELTVPNAFSPNSDGHNDLFVLHGWPNCVSDFTLVIYDRWGEKVFESKDPTISWDGAYKGQILNSGVFVYYIKGKSSTGDKVNKKGNITLIR